MNEEQKKLFEKLSDGIRVVFLIHRSKEGGSNNKHVRHLKKIITTNSEEFFEAIDELMTIKIKDERPLRIYATSNSRDANKAIRLFKHRQIDREFESGEKVENFYLDVKNQFISCLMDNSCKAEKNFLFDLDGCDYRSVITIRELLQKHTEVLTDYKTKNGYHIITKPFEYPKFLDADLINSTHNDGLMLISY